MNLQFDDSSTLAEEIERVQERIESLRDQIGDQESIIEEAESRKEELEDVLFDLLQKLGDLEAMDMNYSWLYAEIGDTEILGEGLEWNEYCFVVRDPHEKLRFADSDFLVLVLMGDTVWGCDDYVPCRGSELTYLSGGIS